MPRGVRGVNFLIITGFLLLALLLSFSTVRAEEKININTATTKELQKLEGIGKTVAQRVVEYREKNGPFKKVDDIRKVKGIGKATFAKIKDHITVGEEKAEAIQK